MNVVMKNEEISDKEKSDRMDQFKQAFVTAVVDYYSNKKANHSLILDL